MTAGGPPAPTSDRGRFQALAARFRETLSADPADLAAAVGLARVLFCAEDWPAAWQAFEVRFRLMETAPEVTRHGAEGPVPLPRWAGGPPPRSLLVLDEQGMGDTIQFARFLKPLVEAGCKVTLVTHRRLFALLRTLGVPLDLRPMGTPGSVAGISAWIPLLSLPLAMGLGPHGLADSAPYLAADPKRVGRWASRIGSRGFRVGIAWQGNPAAPIDANRSAPLAALGALAAVPNLRLVSLQRGHGSDQAGSVPWTHRLEVPGPDFDAGPDAFLDTAALMMTLDLVVTVDTAIAHLAGALGRPVWIALKRSEADWRWLARESDTVWYDTARLYRQTGQADDRSGWWGVFARMAEDIRAIAAADVRWAPAGGRALATAPPQAPVSVGELIDKIGILEIKAERFAPGPKRCNVERELAALREVRERVVPVRSAVGGALAPVETALAAVNRQLWDAEEALREHEARQDFGEAFVALARSIYLTNDERAALKARINDLAGSDLREEKSYRSPPAP